ncbi:hypothetical protein PMAYCL1PPCAC_30320, partial [Pristionchus mayeri]
SIDNYFKVFREDDGNLGSDPPYIGGVSVPDRLYGGLAVAQVVKAVVSLHPHLSPHTVNYKFVSPATASIPIKFKLSQFNEGKMAAITIFQSGKVVGMAHIQSSTEPEVLDSSPFLCPHYNSPNEYASTDELARSGQSHKFIYLQELSYYPMEIRPIETPLFPKSATNRHSTWLRMKPQFHDSLKRSDGLFVVLFMSDFTMLQVASEMYERANVKIKTISSLHHSLRVHETDLDPLSWFLVVVECHVISHRRGRLEALIFDESRKCVMSVVQEGYFLPAPTQSKI